MDATRALKDAENALRDFIEEILSDKYGKQWVEQCGVAPDRIEKWKELRDEEARRLKSGNVDPRLLYYASFYDLPTILKKNWLLFEPCFGKWKIIEAYLDTMEDFRNPDAHRRQLLPHQEQLLCGITGETRTAITNFEASSLRRTNTSRG